MKQFLHKLLFAIIIAYGALFSHDSFAACPTVAGTNSTLFDQPVRFWSGNNTSGMAIGQRTVQLSSTCLAPVLLIQNGVITAVALATNYNASISSAKFTRPVGMCYETEIARQILIQPQLYANLYKQATGSTTGMTNLYPSSTASQLIVPCSITCEAGEYLYHPMDDKLTCQQCEPGYYCPDESVTYSSEEASALSETCCGEIPYDNQLGKVLCPSDRPYSSTGAEGISACNAGVIVNLYQNESDNDNAVNDSIHTYNENPMPTKNISGQTLSAPTRNGYIFAGYWSERTGGTIYYDSNMNVATKENQNNYDLDPVTWDSVSGGNIYAHWIQDQDFKFIITTNSINSFQFSISASGVFFVDWGDGNIDTISRPIERANKPT